MFSSLLIFLACSVTGVFAREPNFFSTGETVTSGGTDENFYSSSWDDGQARAKYTNGKGGEYTVTWSGNKGNFVCGKGWNPGGAR